MKMKGKKQEGSVAIEYVALLAGIAFGLMLVVSQFGDGLSAAFNEITSRLPQINTDYPGI